VGFFSRKTPPTPKTELQVPDELALEAANHYGHAEFLAAANAFATAIDKIHTMSVVAPAGSRIRTAGSHDQEILDGFNKSLGAVLAMDATAAISALVERTLAYLGEIAQEAGPEAERYITAMTDIETTYRLGTS
jgi:hypothetical protein